MTDAIDLTADLPAETYDLEILRPGTTTPSGWKITLAGPSHPKAVAFVKRRQSERLEREAAIAAAQANGRKVKPELRSADQVNRETVEWIVSRIVTWTPIKIAGETIEFSDQAATELLLRPAMAPFLSQIVDYISSERAFMPTSATD